MKSLTEQLVESSQGILKVEPEVSDNEGKYHMFDDGGVTVEEGLLLYGLVKTIQPDNIQETGCYTGISAMYMGQALKENGHGHLTTLEIENTHKLRAEELWNRVGVGGQITCKLQDSLTFTPEEEIDFVFLDSELNLRWHELIRYYPQIKPGSYILIHDFHRHLYKGSRQESLPDFIDWPSGPVPDQIRAWVKEDKLRVTHFPTPRGLTMLYKTDPRDYNWGE